MSELLCKNCGGGVEYVSLSDEENHYRHIANNARHCDLDDDTSLFALPK